MVPPTTYGLFTSRCLSRSHVNWAVYLVRGRSCHTRYYSVCMQGSSREGEGAASPPPPPPPPSKTAQLHPPPLPSQTDPTSPPKILPIIIIMKSTFTSLWPYSDDVIRELPPQDGMHPFAMEMAAIMVHSLKDFHCAPKWLPCGCQAVAVL